MAWRDSRQMQHSKLHISVLKKTQNTTNNNNKKTRKEKQKEKPCLALSVLKTTFPTWEQQSLPSLAAQPHGAGT